MSDELKRYRPGVRAMRDYCRSDLLAFWRLQRHQHHKAPLEVLVKLFGEKV